MDTATLRAVYVAVYRLATKRNLELRELMRDDSHDPYLKAYYEGIYIALADVRAILINLENSSEKEHTQA